jgi:FkbM family methyltransferase
VIPDRAVLLDTLGRLWLLGVPIEWRRILSDGHDARAHALHAHLSVSPAGPPAVELGIGASRSPDVAPEAAAGAAPEAAPVGHRGRPGLRPRPQLFTAFVAPDGDLELELATLWRDVLDLEAVGVDDNFFEVGGHSLLAMFILDHLERTTGVKLPLSVLFDHPTITQLAQALVTLQAPEGTRSQDMSAAAHPGARSGAAHHGRYRLPNGLEITHQNKAETDHFYADIFEHRTYLRQLGRLPELACVFDVGANIGLFSLLVHTLDENAMIYAFEPSPPTFEILKHNLSDHRVRAKLFEIGLSDVEKTTDFTFYPFSSGMSSVYGDRAEERAVLQGIIQNQVHGDRSGGMEQVAAYSEDLIEQRLRSQKLTCRLRTISSVIREEGIERIDLLKIDVQKSELDVLMGIESRDWGKIHAIVIEVHDLDGRLHIVEQLLRKHAFEVEIQQDDLYRGTAIYLVHAKRADGQLGGATKRARHS